ncbi:hypothetical protein [Spirosoma koreense]
MSDAFVINIPDKQTLNNAAQLMARLSLPAGSYVIIGKAQAAALKLNGTIDFNQPFESKLICQGVEDSCLLNLYSDSTHGGNWGTFTLTIGVDLQQAGEVEIRCTPGNPGCILLFNVVISAIRVENMKVINAGPPAQDSDKPNPFRRIISQTTTLEKPSLFKLILQDS